MDSNETEGAQIPHLALQVRVGLPG